MPKLAKIESAFWLLKELLVKNYYDALARVERKEPFRLRIIRLQSAGCPWHPMALHSRRVTDRLAGVYCYGDSSASMLHMDGLVEPAR